MTLSEQRAHTLAVPNPYHPSSRQYEAIEAARVEALKQIAAAEEREAE